ncbi:MAG: dihydroorotase [Firmicutes bacterium]|nr:dihydroorotase [Bacillota bacterium]
MKLLIKNGQVVQDGKTTKADILIEDDRISKIAPSVEKIKDAKEIDAKGLHVMAGFVDMHTHLREPGFEYKEDLESGSRAAIAGGYTSLACMPNTMPVIDNAYLVDYIMNAPFTRDIAVKIYPIGAVTKGQKGEELAEIGLMKKAGIVAISDDGRPIENAQIMRQALEYADTFGVLLISHCEDMALAGDGVVNEGYNSTITGLKAIPTASEEVMVSRDIILAEYLGVRVHIAHISTEGSVRLIRDAKKRGVKVTCETCPHYFSATDDEILNFNTNAKMNPPLRAKKDVQAIIEGIKDGTIDCLATDHAPHANDEKNVEFAYAANGTVGLETAFSVAYTHLVKPGHITLERLSELMSKTPAKLLGLDDAEIKVGNIADLTIVDLNKSHKVDAQKLSSKSKNSLFDGWKLNGQIVHTIIDGEVKFSK